MCGWMLLPWLYQQDLGRRLDRCCYDQLSLFQLKDTLNLSTVLSTAYFDLILHLLWRLWTLTSHGCRHGGSLNMLFQAVDEAFWHRQSGIWTTCFRLTHELAKKMCDAVDQPLTPAVKSITQLWIWLMHWASLQVTTYINTWYICCISHISSWCHKLHCRACQSAMAGVLHSTYLMHSSVHFS